MEFDDYINEKTETLSLSSTTRHKCSSLTDELWISSGIERVLQKVSSGREYLQTLHDGGCEIPLSTYFDSNCSKRRANHIKNVLDKFIQTQYIEPDLDPIFEAFPVLKEFEIRAIDGHHIQHSTHSNKVVDKNGDLSYLSSNTLYIHDLRTRMVSPFEYAGSLESKEHEMKALKRAFKNLPSELRRSIYIVDRAYFDAPFWNNMKNAGMYTVQRMKENVKHVSSIPLTYDKTDSINNGVISYDMVASDKGEYYYQITYYCHLRKETFKFATTLKNFPPGVIPYLYKLRWNIEKVFDVFKNELFEKKAWSKKDYGQKIQSCFIALTYNLMITFENYLYCNHALSDEKVIKKQADRNLKMMKTCREQVKRMNPLYFRVKKASRLSCQFIRSFRYHYIHSTLIQETIEIFKRHMLAYI